MDGALLRSLHRSFSASLLLLLFSSGVSDKSSHLLNGLLISIVESKIPAKSAVLPPSVWKITNIVITSLAIGIACG